MHLGHWEEESLIFDAPSREISLAFQHFLESMLSRLE